MSTTANDLASLAADYTRWHIWRGRSESGRETDWHATSRQRGENGRCARRTAPDAAGLRALLAQDEALSMVAGMVAA